MIPMERGLELHGKACASVELSDSEKIELDAWYAQMDAEEAKELHIGFEGHPTIEELQEKLRSDWARIATIVEEIQALDAASEALRKQNDALKRKLAEKGVSVS